VGRFRLPRELGLGIEAATGVREELRQQLLGAAERLEAEGAERAARAQLAELLSAWRAPDASTAELVERYCKLGEATSPGS
jgi:hypothetical protein